VRLNDLKLNGQLSAFNKPDAPWASQMKQQLGGASLLAGATPLAQLGPSHMDIKLDDKGGNFDISYRPIWTASSCRPRPAGRSRTISTSTSATTTSTSRP
jgi:hypothetical protein